MATFVAAMASAETTSTEIGHSLSGIFGCISLVAWICLLLPQLITNYKNQNADALSMGFLVIWLLGDLTNLAGALFTAIAPSAIAIGSYFCVADLILISQCLYYNTRNAARRRRQRQRQRNHPSSSAAAQQTDSAISADDDEESPLLSRERSGSANNGGGLPGSHRRQSVRRGSSGLDPLARMVTGEDETPQRSAWVTNGLSLVAVYVLGIAAWFVSREVLGADAGAPNEDDGASAGGDGSGSDGAPDRVFMIVGLALGYTSALCYLTARIPQILKNYREKSTEGLALLFFLLSLTGNLTYGASVLAYSQEGAYLLRVLPWLLGSLGTIVEDSVIFVQFQLYKPKKEAKSAASGIEDGDGNGSGAAQLPAYEP